MFNVFILKRARNGRPVADADFPLVARQKAKSRFHPKVETAEAWASMEQSVHEQGDQDDDRDRYTEEKQQ
ncbi:hypothetical protein [Pseudomonas sp. Irchel 3H7]|uniref:hypothetical protein n=1 Tax=Pseudomonas sp. Irchel 3H7 TaxID=2009042 RepID=UPI0011400F7D|nr:hypothetical protein [Pseudomonas sp. Irchel 3H7]